MRTARFTERWWNSLPDPLLNDASSVIVVQICNNNENSELPSCLSTAIIPVTIDLVKRVLLGQRAFSRLQREGLSPRALEFHSDGPLHATDDNAAEWLTQYTEALRVGEFVDGQELLDNLPSNEFEFPVPGSYFPLQQPARQHEEDLVQNGTSVNWSLVINEQWFWFLGTDDYIYCETQAQQIDFLFSRNPFDNLAFVALLEVDG